MISRSSSELTRCAATVMMLIASCAAGTPRAPLSSAAPPPEPVKGAPAPPAPPTMEAMLKPSVALQQVAREVGTWDVVMTLRTTPDAKPVVVGGMIAERTMVGLYLTETMHPAPGSNVPDFLRIDYLTYDNVQSRWEYVSMDTRAPIGIMFGRGFANDSGTAITAYFDNFPNPGLGGEVGGSIRARHVDVREGDDRTFKRQYWMRPGAPEWLAVEYAYTRRR